MEASPYSLPRRLSESRPARIAGSTPPARACARQRGHETEAPGKHQCLRRHGKVRLQDEPASIRGAAGDNQ